MKIINKMLWILLLFIYCLIGVYNCEENDIVVLQSKNYPSYSIAVGKSASGEAVWIFESQKFPLAHTKFHEVKGLVYQNTKLKGKIPTEKIVSFQLGKNLYLRHRGFYFYLDEQPVNDAAALSLFQKDASFVVREQKDEYKGYIRFESYNFPRYFIRHDGFRLKIEAESQDDSFKEVSSFLKIPSTGKSVTIETPPLVGYVGVDGSNEPRIVSEQSAAQLQIVAGFFRRGSVSLKYTSRFGHLSRTRYLHHVEVGSVYKKLVFSSFSSIIGGHNRNITVALATATFYTKSDGDNSQYKSFQSVDITSHYIHSDGNKLTLQLLPNIPASTKPTYFTIQPQFNPRYVTLATVASIHYIGTDGAYTPSLYSVPKTLQIVPGLVGKGTVSFKVVGKETAFLLHGMNQQNLEIVVFAKNDGGLSESDYNSAASLYLEEINHEFVFLRSYKQPGYYIHSGFDGIKLLQKSKSADKKGFSFKINPDPSIKDGQIFSTVT